MFLWHFLSRIFVIIFKLFYGLQTLPLESNKSQTEGEMDQLKKKKSGTKMQKNT